MKKIYTVLAFAAALSASAAIAPANQLKQKEATRVNTIASEMYGITSVDASAKEGMMKAPAQPDLNGLYQLGFFGMTQAESERQYRILKFEQINEKEVLVYGLFFYFPLKGNYDASTMCLSFPAQEVAPVGTFSKTEPVNFYPQQLVVDGSTITGEINKDSFKIYYRPDGIELDGGSKGFVKSWVFENELDLMEFNLPSNLSGTSGFLTGWKYGVVFGDLSTAYPNAPEFVYNESEWDYIGESEFTDGWFGTVYDPALGPWKVKTMQNKAKKDQYLLVNPYGNSADEGILQINETLDAQGFIYLDCSDPDLVVVRPNILSGFACSELFLTKTPLICTSVESIDYSINEVAKEDIIADAAIFDDPLPVLKDGVVTIPNCVFQYPSNKFTDTDGVWVDKATEKPIEMTAVVKLPTGAVDGIIADSENSPVRYYNLQGMEVANPEAGQLVIKKQGSKTTKLIAR